MKRTRQRHLRKPCNLRKQSLKRRLELSFRLSILLCFFGTTVAMLTPVIAQQTGASPQMSMPKALVGDIHELAEIRPRKHPGLGHFTAELGDLNGDGYDDYAVTSSLDTTFIFYGGDPIPVEPTYYVLGGSGGVAAGDFNGDGLVDMATTIKRFSHDPDPEERGRIRIYFNTGSNPPFNVEADQVLQGRPGKPGERWGYWGGMHNIRVYEPSI